MPRPIPEVLQIPKEDLYLQFSSWQNITHPHAHTISPKIIKTDKDRIHHMVQTIHPHYHYVTFANVVQIQRIKTQRTMLHRHQPNK